jgi:hypothetical protein
MRGRSDGWRRRWDLLKDFLAGGLQPGDGGLQPSDLVRHLVLTGRDPIDGLPQRGEIRCYLMHLLRIDRGGGRR